MKEKFIISAPILTVILMLISISWVGVITIAEHTKAVEIDRSYEASKQLAKVFAQQVERVIDSAEGLIDFAAFALLQGGSPHQLKEMAEFGAFSFSPVIQIAFVDPQGFTLATNTGLDLSRTDLRDREHIRVHLDAKVKGLYVGAPVLGRVSGKWSIQLTRKIFDQDKKFIGIIVASIDPFYFHRFWRETLNSGQLVSLLREDGVLMTRSSGLQWALEAKLRRADIVKRIAGHQEGRLIAESSEGVERLSYFTRVSRLPLIVISGQDMSDVKKAYERKTLEFFAIGITLTFILSFLGIWLIVFSWRLRNKEQAALKAEHTARDAEKKKSHFIATMSHEIRTPLNALIGFSEILRKTPLNDEQKKYLQLVSSSAMTLRNIVTDVLDFSKIEIGALKIENKPFNFRECCDQLKSVTSMLVGDKSIEVRVILTTDIPETITIDGLRFYQALLNVCGNAAKFTENGEIIISARILKQTDFERLVVTIMDTGPGVNEAVKSKLFTPFEQGQVSGQLRAAGTGLGLAITKRLLEQMGGSIKMESIVGKGTTFTIEMPFERLNTLNNSESIVTKVDPIGQLRVLVADDAPASRMLLRILLEQKGHAVIEANDGIEALEIERSHDFDLLILDLQMPRLGGLEVAKHITQSNTSKAAPLIVALSAQAQPEDMHAAATAGVSLYITKPFLEKDLEKVLELASRRKDTDIPNKKGI